MRFNLKMAHDLKLKLVLSLFFVFCLLNAKEPENNISVDSTDYIQEIPIYQVTIHDYLLLNSIEQKINRFTEFAIQCYGHKEEFLYYFVNDNSLYYKDLTFLEILSLELNYLKENINQEQLIDILDELNTKKQFALIEYISKKLGYLEAYPQLDLYLSFCLKNDYKCFSNMIVLGRDYPLYQFELISYYTFLKKNNISLDRFLEKEVLEKFYDNSNKFLKDGFFKTLKVQNSILRYLILEFEPERLQIDYIAKSYFTKATKAMIDGKTLKGISYLKKYKMRNANDSLYVNHLIAENYYKIYRYNNSAYYWIKNLSEEKTVFDSLSLYKLASLYYFTKKYNISENYFDLFFQKYSYEKYDVFVKKYLQVLDINKRHSKKENFLVSFANIFEKKEIDLLLNDILDNYIHKNDVNNALRIAYKIAEIFDNDEKWYAFEKWKLHFGIYKNEEEFSDSLIFYYPDNVFSQKILLKRYQSYLHRNERDKIVSDSLFDMINDVKIDSLYWIRGKVHFENQNYENALEELFSINRDSLLIKEVRKLIFEHKEIFEDSEILDFLSSALNNKYHDDFYYETLLMIAEIYREKSFLSESNLVYQQILDDSLAVIDKSKVKLLMAENLIKMEDFQKLSEVLYPVIDENDSDYSQKALYLSYVSYVAQNDEEKQFKTLLILFYKYPTYKPEVVYVELFKMLLDRELYGYAYQVVSKIIKLEGIDKKYFLKEKLELEKKIDPLELKLSDEYLRKLMIEEGLINEN